ncbi:olfactory receptor 5AR1-like [Ambystoma mexicanum]|uniref:olfactory receptor 5AR1-like n=1 Tax=Ambystoma mexicanum TaxID=8296 RepID=UPI0037E9ABA4
MEVGNQTLHIGFTFLGLTHEPHLKVLLFTLFTLVYTFTMVGNIGIIVLIWLASRLHTPMYFFLYHLSFVDLCYSSAIAPRMLADLVSKGLVISLISCMVQLFFLCGFASVEAILLAVMAYDRYVAVCQPLHYMTIMTERLCARLVAAAYIGGILHSLVEVTCTSRLPFCRWEINHFCCDVPPLLKLSCSGTLSNEIAMFIFGGSLVITSVLGVLLSYGTIILAVLRMHSSAARLRVFSTCFSHFTGVLLYFGTILFTYLRPSSSYSLDQDKAVTLFYTAVIPMLNPLIYSLRNQDVKEALRQIMVRTAKHC